MNTEKVKMPKFLYEKTSEEYFNVPMFRFIGQENTFTITNNLQKAQVDLPVEALDSLMGEMLKYREAGEL